MKPGIDPRVDYAFKRVFGSVDSTPILADLLNAVLAPSVRPIVELELLNPFNERDAADDKLSILDIKAKDDLDHLYNVEMQLFGSLLHLHRVLYYWAVLHSEQLREGDKYTALRPTISIAIVNTTIFADVPEYHHEFRLRSVGRPELILSPHLSIHLIELPKFAKTAEELTDALDVWCYFLKHAADLDKDQLPAALQTPMVQRAMEVLEMLSRTDVERDRYQARLKWERDQTAYLDEAREEGLQRGKLIERIQLRQELLKLPITAETELRSFSFEDLQARAAALDKQMRNGTIES